MHNKSNTVMNEGVARRGGRGPLIEAARLCLGFLLLGVICLGMTLAAVPMQLILPRTLSRRTGRAFIARASRSYLRLLELMGACRFDLAALDALRDGPAMIIAPNHPSLLDAIMILSRLPNAACIMKTDIVNSFLFGAGARLAGYISNRPLRTMVQLAVADLQQGSHLLLFPEGTRTIRFPIGPVQGTTGLVAKYAGVPVQAVLVETDSGFLGKGWSLWWLPKMPITYRIRLGKRFDPPRHTAQFAAELDEYFQSGLAQAQLPDFPVSRPVA